MHLLKMEIWKLSRNSRGKSFSFVEKVFEWKYLKVHASLATPKSCRFKSERIIQSRDFLSRFHTQRPFSLQWTDSRVFDWNGNKAVEGVSWPLFTATYDAWRNWMFSEPPQNLGAGKVLKERLMRMSQIWCYSLPWFPLALITLHFHIPWLESFFLFDLFSLGSVPLAFLPNTFPPTCLAGKGLVRVGT